jgi:hypothetical protein
MRLKGISPVIERVVRRPTLSLKGEGHTGSLEMGERLLAPLLAPSGSGTCGMLPSGFV